MPQTPENVKFGGVRAMDFYKVISLCLVLTLFHATGVIVLKEPSMLAVVSSFPTVLLGLAIHIVLNFRRLLRSSIAFQELIMVIFAMVLLFSSSSSDFLTTSATGVDNTLELAIKLLIYSVSFPATFTAVVVFVEAKDVVELERRAEEPRAPFVESRQTEVLDHTPKANCDKVLSGCTSQAPIRQHSPSDIAILRSARHVFYDWDEASTRENLEKTLKNTNSRDIEVIRRLQPGEVDDSYDELPPLLCREIVHHPDAPKTEVSKIYRDRYSENKKRVWLKTQIGGAVFTVLVFPAKIRDASGGLVDQSFISNKVVCGWQVYEGPVLKTAFERGALDISKLSRLNAVCKARQVQSLKTLASYAVVRQFDNDVDQLFSLIPSSVIADLKGR